MATNFGSAESSAEKAREARETLDALDRDQELLAAKTATPRWYYPVIAASAAATAISPGLRGAWGNGLWTFSLGLVSVILIVVLPILAARRGIVMPLGTFGRGSRIFLAALVATLVLCMLAAGRVRDLDLSGWLLGGIGALAFALVWFLGARADRAHRAELAQAAPR